MATKLFGESELSILMTVIMKTLVLGRPVQLELLSIGGKGNKKEKEEIRAINGAREEVD